MAMFYDAKKRPRRAASVKDPVVASGVASTYDPCASRPTSQRPTRGRRSCDRHVRQSWHRHERLRRSSVRRALPSERSSWPRSVRNGSSSWPWTSRAVWPYELKTSRAPSTCGRWTSCGHPSTCARSSSFVRPSTSAPWTSCDHPSTSARCSCDQSTYARPSTFGRCSSCVRRSTCEPRSTSCDPCSSCVLRWICVPVERRRQRYLQPRLRGSGQYRSARTIHPRERLRSPRRRSRSRRHHALFKRDSDLLSWVLLARLQLCSAPLRCDVIVWLAHEPARNKS